MVSVSRQPVVHYLFHHLAPRLRTMSVFTKKLNPITGKDEWEIHDENYDFHQEIARSAFADMLHDSERNKLYYVGVKLAVEKMHKAGRQANVLDIGTGTGLLSMMAAASGADSIVACEAFQPMAECAVKIIRENGYEDKIRVVHKRSTELTVGEKGDMQQRANILVTEVFDTELIGEGALGTFSHAHRELLEKDCIVVPSSSTIYAQVVETSLAQQWNKLNPLMLDGQVLVDTPEKVRNCPGAAAVHDIQLSQFSEKNFKTIFPPTPIFRFDWTGATPLPMRDTSVVRCQASRSGVAQVVFMWWDLAMDEEGDVVLSCAPAWAHPAGPAGLPWRDHWMQALYYLPAEVALTRGDEVALVGHHDEYSLWFDLQKDVDNVNTGYTGPACDCGVHLSHCRTRIGAMNDSARNAKYLAALRECCSTVASCLCLGDGTLLGLAAARLGVARVYCVEENNVAKRTLHDYVKHNRLDDRVVIADSVEDVKKMADDKIGLVFGEPHFLTTLLPWQNISFWYLKQELLEVLSPNAVVMPRAATVWAMAVEFNDLWKIRAPLGTVEGFSMEAFDRLIERSGGLSDHAVEAQPLWEYPCRPLGQPFTVLRFDFEATSVDCLAEGKSGAVKLEGSGTFHGMVLWVDWDVDGNEKNVVTTGPLETPVTGAEVVWDMHTRQGVYFFRGFQQAKAGDALRYAAQFEANSGEVVFDFHLDARSENGK